MTDKQLNRMNLLCPKYDFKIPINTSRPNQTERVEAVWRAGYQSAMTEKFEALEAELSESNNDLRSYISISANYIERHKALEAKLKLATDALEQIADPQDMPDLAEQIDTAIEALDKIKEKK